MAMPPTNDPLATLDFIAKAQLALLHAAVARPTFAWETIQQLVNLWKTSNARRYQAQGVAMADIPISLRMVYRDYLQEIRGEDPEEAERLALALGPEMEG